MGDHVRKVLTGIATVGLIALSPLTEATPAGEMARLPLGWVNATQGREEVGIASWYGEEFDGNSTASGKLFDLNGLTAAHRSLPMGTRIQVTNLRNQRSMVLTVNDRGPFVRGRLVDVSKAAAFRLGFMASGRALVKIRVVGHPESYTPD
ncbi:MAG: septal ring lytic transglycosylase RlpA family lipoprotein [Acidobacteria bacterium]|nr:MAG: septal ring lytic transglycosylase RlpA family lipoprotein [Acidobacteriota bacterium]